jgi:hypothetical protein
VSSGIEYLWTPCASKHHPLLRLLFKTNKKA